MENLGESRDVKAGPARHGLWWRRVGLFCLVLGIAESFWAASRGVPPRLFFLAMLGVPIWLIGVGKRG